MRFLLIQSIIYRGQPRPDPCYVRRLSTLLTRADYVLQHEVDDYEDALRTASSEYGVFMVNKDICRLLHVLRSLLYFYLAR